MLINLKVIDSYSDLDTQGLSAVLITVMFVSLINAYLHLSQWQVLTVHVGAIGENVYMLPVVEW